MCTQCHHCAPLGAKALGCSRRCSCCMCWDGETPLCLISSCLKVCYIPYIDIRKKLENETLACNNRAISPHVWVHWGKIYGKRTMRLEKKSHIWYNSYAIASAKQTGFLKWCPLTPSQIHPSVYSQPFQISQGRNDGHFDRQLCRIFQTNFF